MAGGSPGLWTRRQHLHSGLKRDLAIGEVDHKGGGDAEAGGFRECCWMWKRMWDVM